MEQVLTESQKYKELTDALAANEQQWSVLKKQIAEFDWKTQQPEIYEKYVGKWFKIDKDKGESDMFDQQISYIKVKQLHVQGKCIAFRFDFDKIDFITMQLEVSVDLTELEEEVTEEEAAKFCNSILSRFPLRKTGSPSKRSNKPKVEHGIY